MKTLLFFFLFLNVLYCDAQPFSGDYRSKTSGNWNSASSWQRYNGTAWVDAASFPLSADGEVTILNGHNITITISNNVDQVIINAGGTLTVNCEYFNVTAGPDGAADLKIYGTFTWNTGWAGNCALWEVYSGGVANMNFGIYGSACNNWSIKPGGIMNFLDVSGYINTVTINNEGIINFDPNFYGRHLKNNLVSLTDAGVINNLASGVVNFNTVYDFALGWDVETNIQFNNNGTVNIANEAAMSFYGDRFFNNNGTVQIGTNAVLNIHTVFNWDGGGITGTGKIISNSGWHTNVAATLPQGITLDIKPGYYDFFGGPAELTVNGVVNLTGTLSNLNFSSDIVKLAIGATGIGNIIANNPLSLENARLTNNGTLNFLSTASESAIHMFESQVINNGQVKVHGTGYSYVFGDEENSFINNGTIETLAGGKLDASSSDGNVVFRNMATGSIKGVGTIHLPANFVNAGFIEPGASPGILNTVTGPNLLQPNSTLKIEIADNSGAGTGHDQVIAAGALQLAGKLVVTELPGTINNGAFEIIKLNSGNITGSFSSVQLPPSYVLSVSSNRVSVVKSIVLPLRFLSFEAIANKNKVLLSWKTDNEINTSHFLIERSSNGIYYETIGSTAAQNAPGTHQYQFTDNQLLTGYNHYRIRQVDIDDHFSFSDTRTIKIEPQKIQSVYPSITADIITVKSPGNNYLLIYDLQGKRMKEQLFRDNVDVSLKSFTAGTYIIRIIQGQNTSSYKVIKN